MPDELDELRRQVDLLSSQREIEQMIFQVGHALEAGDFQRVGDIMGDATMGADMIGRKAFKGTDEIRDQYDRTNIVYPDRGRASKELYTNIVFDFDLDNTRATSVTSYTVAHQPPDEVFELIVSGRYEDEWRRVDGKWTWVDRYIVVQYKNSLDRHMHSGSQPYN
ncbi:MAG TPA: nuclear transport factor 2 family protein [Acidimicrobiales bacterium]|nr:nuclear transport factor 2 family protein [Acidimicrobiales bacterium]